jgi:hypothetical protein
MKCVVEQIIQMLQIVVNQVISVGKNIPTFINVFQIPLRMSWVMFHLKMKNQIIVQRLMNHVVVPIIKMLQIVVNQDMLVFTEVHFIPSVNQKVKILIVP